MGRHPKVSREQALGKAMKLFWARGYSATTMDDIQEAMGLQRGSVYAYFKNKQNLFREALELYQKEIVGERKQRVKNAENAKAGIELFFSILIEHSLKNREFPGCLNTNTAAELSVIDDKMGDRSKLGLKSWESFWLEILEKAKGEGSLAPEQDLRATARLIIALAQGINVVSKVNPDGSYLQSIAKSGLSFLK